MQITRLLFLAAFELSQTVAAAPAQDGDPTPRKGIGPADAAKVKQFEAQRWLGFGARSSGSQAEGVQSSVSGVIPGQRSCTTQIGPTAPPNLGAAGRPNSSPRFGQNNDNVVVVTGSVIAVCR